ncbi:ScyD/ScyE family protein [Micromonospora sp. SL4-19]|uniref:ScyD/ScyE family protein n=1 Tax=Micromonospora sp. SL4-19 TaxID=3399129 RepID=UPI003A4E39D4
MALVLPGAAPASAATVSDPVISGLAGPLQLAVGSDGTVYVSQSFAGKLTAVGKKGRTDLVSTPGAEIAGVAAEGLGTVTFTTSAEDGSFAQVKRVLPNGKIRAIGDLGRYEATVNPDQVNSYGFQGLTPECAAQVPAEIGADPYPGIVESHPYSVAILPDGSRAVADAAGNDIVRVAPNGTISTIAVLPPAPSVITAELAASVGLPDCTVGKIYNFEPVPTDVELGRDGLLYVSSLPGGPEDPSFGARGGVYSVNPTTGKVTRIASGFLGATNLAVAPDGTIYVAELFGNRISTVSRGGAKPFANVPFPAAVEWANGKLYATTDVFGNGSVVTITP